MASSILTRRGGGSKINGIIESYKVKAGENISAGEFVDYINSQDLTLSSPVVFNNSYTSSARAISLSSEKIVIVYGSLVTVPNGTASAPTVIVGIISGSSISFGEPTVFASNGTSKISAVALGSDKIVVSYRDNANSGRGTSIIGTVDGLSVSFGIPTIFDNAITDTNYSSANISLTALSSDKIVVGYSNNGSSNHGTAIVGTITGLTISFGSPIVFNSAITSDIATVALDSDKIVVSYRNGGNSYYSTAIVGTINELSVSFGDPIIYDNNNGFSGNMISLNNNKIIIGYTRIDSSYYGTSIVGTVSGSSISFGTPVIYNTTGSGAGIIAVLSSNKIIAAYNNYANAYRNEYIIGTVDGSSISWSGPTPFGNSFNFLLSLDLLGNNKILIIYGSGNPGGRGFYIIGEFEKLLIPATEDVFGVAKKKGTGGDIIPVYIDQTAQPFKLDELLQSYRVAFGQNISAGTFVDYINSESSISYINSSPTVFNSATTSPISAVALGSDKIVVSYSNIENSNYGTSIVGTVSGSSISWGSPIVFNSATTSPISAVALSSDKIVVSYRNNESPATGTSIVGTVSGSSISWGSPIVFNSANTTNISAVALGSDKIVVSYSNAGISFQGTSIVGTVSGSSISFGSPTEFNSANTSIISAVALGSDKIVVNYRNNENSGRGTSIIGTVSGSSISFGSPTVFNSASTFDISTVALGNDKIVVSYSNIGNSFYGTSIVGTISGSSISFGSPTVFNSSYTFSISAVALGSDKIVVSYSNGSGYGTSIIGTISGSSISFSSPTVFNSASTDDISAVDLSSDKIVVSYRNIGNSFYGTSIIGEIEKLIISADTNIFGLSKTGGLAGEIIDVYINK
jgi:hypothetical protein